MRTLALYLLLCVGAAFAQFPAGGGGGGGAAGPTGATGPTGPTAATVTTVVSPYGTSGTLGATGDSSTELYDEVNRADTWTFTYSAPGTVTALTLVLQGSIDGGATWFTITGVTAGANPSSVLPAACGGTCTVTTAGGLPLAANTAPIVRLYLSAYTGTGNITYAVTGSTTYTASCSGGVASGVNSATCKIFVICDTYCLQNMGPSGDNLLTLVPAPGVDKYLIVNFNRFMYVFDTNDYLGIDSLAFFNGFLQYGPMSSAQALFQTQTAFGFAGLSGADTISGPRVTDVYRNVLTSLENNTPWVISVLHGLAAGNILTTSINNAGAGYVGGEVGYITCPYVFPLSTASESAQVQIDTVDPGDGHVTGYTLYPAQGFATNPLWVIGYLPTTNCNTNTGGGFTIDINSVSPPGKGYVKIGTSYTVGPVR